MTFYAVNDMGQFVIQGLNLPYPDDLETLYRKVCNDITLFFDRDGGIIVFVPRHNLKTYVVGNNEYTIDFSKLKNDFLNIFK